ncbi:MAG: uL15 family ribosomal protein [Candidatus Hodarchaeota archaeon]
MNLSVNQASKQAIEKIEAAGGKVTLLAQIE